MSSERDAYNDLCYYTLAHGDASFIHQHVVDAFAAQRADENSKPIGVTFALIGLYLHVEKHFSGRQVQHIHMQLARRKRSWPTFNLPSNRGEITVVDVVAAPAGADRDRAIHDWCAKVWEAYAANQQTIAGLLREYGIA